MTGNKEYVFFLGGHDLEMLVIRDLLARQGAPYVDKGLGWGAKASAYQKEIGKAVRQKRLPVLVELEDDTGLAGNEVVIVDHHGTRAGVDKPTALEQVWRLLEMPHSDWQEARYEDLPYPLIAANDRGHVRAMQYLGATQEQMTKVRELDRKAQGITEQQERQAQVGIERAQHRLHGRLTVVQVPHAKTATVTDRLHVALGGPGYENLLIVSPDETNFYGRGEAICRLDKQWPGGWSGGELPDRGFWGIGRALVADEVAEVLKSTLNRSSL